MSTQNILMYAISATASLHAAALCRRLGSVKIFFLLFFVESIVFAGMQADFNVVLLVVLSSVGAVGYYFLQRYFLDEDDGSKIRRGAVVVSVRDVRKMLKREKSRFDIGGVPVPIEQETRSFLFAGSPGSGKSQAMMRALDALEKAGARAILADPSGIFCERYFSERRGDVILNPYDARCVSWSPLAEIESIRDIPALAKSLIPDTEGEGKFWSENAQKFLEAIIQYCYKEGLANREIYKFIRSTPIEQLREILRDTPAEVFLHPGNERMFESVRSSTATALDALQWLDPRAGRDAFSIRKHVAEEKPGWIFLTYEQQHLSSLQRMICACLDVASLALLRLRPNLNRRFIFALDELPLLGKVESLPRLLTNGRKHGSVAFVGLQTISQLQESYGKSTAQTMLACLGSWLVLKVSDVDTADFMSRYIGEQEIERFTESVGKTKSWVEPTSRNSDSLQQQILRQRALLASELQRLRDLIGYFSLAGLRQVVRVKLTLVHERTQAPAFVPAPEPMDESEREKTAPAQARAQQQPRELDLDAGLR